MSFRNRLLFICVGCLIGSGAAAESTPQDKPAGPGRRSIEVPIDHQDPAGGTFALNYEIGAPFDPKLRTVFAVADGQQFWVRPEAMASLQDEIIGRGVNFVGVFGRSTSETITARVHREDGTVDWTEAYRLYHSGQWVEDLEKVRKALVGDGRIGLYGRSGGAMLVHEYLGKYGEHADRAFTQAAVATRIEARSGLRYDRFWDELDDDTRARLLEVLRQRPGLRANLILCLQRQNFFVQATQIKDARRDLIRAVHRGDEEALARARKDYQVDAVRSLLEGDRGSAIAVRQYEFVMPLRKLAQGAGAPVSPSFEAVRMIAGPLIEEHDKGRVPYPPDRYGGRPSPNTEVFVLAGRHDHTVDYRGQIALAARYPKGRLFIADDNHVMGRVRESGHYRSLVRAVLLSGEGSPEWNRVLEDLEPLRWSEWN